MSAKIPGAIATTELAKAPDKSLKARNAPQLRAKAHDMVNKVKRTKLTMVIYLRPYSSLRGAHTMGPVGVSY